MEGTGRIMKKLNKHPKHKDKTLEEKQELAIELTDPKKLRLRFNRLLHVDTKHISHEKDDIFNSTDFQEHNEEMKQKVAEACNLPVRLSLRNIKERKIPFIYSLASLFRFEYGPFHALLTVGDVVLTWGPESLIEPRIDNRVEAAFRAIVDQGEWGLRRDDFIQQISMADGHENKEDIIPHILSEKAQVIDRLVEVIAEYNRTRIYSTFQCSCQNFVRDAMSALGIDKPVQFSGRLQQRFEQVIQGTLQVPLELKSHKKVDTHAQAFKHNLERQDMEYLQCLYYDFHLPAIEKSDDPEAWQCGIPTCMSEELDKMITENYVSFQKLRW